MTTQTGKEKAKMNIAETGPFEAVFGRREKAASGLDWAVFGCLVAGAVGILKALRMESPAGVLLCLLASVVAFGLVIYVHLRKQ